MIIIKCENTNNKKSFADVKDRECFYSGGVLYMKILSSDLREYGITNVNAISIDNAGLTYFQDDEEVMISTKEIERIRK